MGFDFKGFLGSVAPMIGAAFGGPFGAAGAKILVDKLGLTKKDGTAVDPQDQQQVQDALMPLTSDPATLLKMKEADNEFAETMAKLGYADAADVRATNLELEKSDAADRDSARKREISVRDYTPEIGFYLLVIIFAIFMRWIFKWPVPQENRAIAYSMIGSLGTLVVMAATYFYGTTRQSAQKDVALANSMPVVDRRKLSEGGK